MLVLLVAVNFHRYCNLVASLRDRAAKVEKIAWSKVHLFASPRQAVVGVTVALTCQGMRQLSHRGREGAVARHGRLIWTDGLSAD